jgi:hypothetical protein
VEGRVLGPLSDEPAALGALVPIRGVGDGLEPGEAVGGDVADALAVAAHFAGVPHPGLELSIVEGRLHGQVEPGIEVRFGDAGQLEAKVRSLRTVLDQVDLACAAVIDVRSPGSPVLTREEGCS